MNIYLFFFDTQTFENLYSPSKHGRQSKSSRRPRNEKILAFEALQFRNEASTQKLKTGQKLHFCLSVCLNVNQDSTNYNCGMHEISNPVCTDLLMNFDHKPKTRNRKLFQLKCRMFPQVSTRVSGQIHSISLTTPSATIKNPAQSNFFVEHRK